MIPRHKLVDDGPKRRLITLLALVASLLPARAQYVDLWQSQANTAQSIWLPTLKYIKMDVEAERDVYRSSAPASQQEFQRLYVAPALGIGWNYYIYHPYLLTYSLLFEPGYSW